MEPATYTWVCPVVGSSELFGFSTLSFLQETSAMQHKNAVRINKVLFFMIVGFNVLVFCSIFLAQKYNLLKDI